MSDGLEPVCPKCERKMMRRTGRYVQFWGCSNYPRCRGTRDILKTEV
ncbi:topoisomerase DNA-binding C4 zinc finger domain-containing protein [Geomonas agri]|nr:topoisomerase DNA-binding C4 zinc finger domain-containing protein [Geomonas agri]